MAYESASDHTKHNGHAEPKELEERLEHTRAEIDDTLAQIERKLTPGEILDETIEYLRYHGPGPFVTELAEQLKERPLPAALSVVGAAWATKQAASIAVTLARRPLPVVLTAVGVAWFMMAADAGDDEDFDTWRRDDEVGTDPGATLRRFGRKLRGGAARVKEAAADTFEKIHDTTAASAATAGEVAENLRDTAQRATRAAGDVASSATERVETTASHLADSAAGAAAGLKHAATEAFDATREAARSAAHSGGRMAESARGAARMAFDSSSRVAHSAREATARGGERTMQAATELEATIRRHPLVTAMLLAAVGGVVAAMLPTTEREDALIGEKAEQLKDTAWQTARDQLERGKRVVSAAAEGALEGAREAATEVAEKEGLLQTDEQQGAKGAQPTRESESGGSTY